ncbi:replicative DNA helicase [compost metagenome]
MARIPTSDLVNKVFAFCQAYSGVEFFPYQAQFAKRIIRSVLENDGEEITALFSRQCLHRDTEVLMSNLKRKKISEIKPGDKVLGFDYDRFRVSEVTAAYSAGMQEIFLLTLENGKKIKTTQNHRFLDKYSRLFRPLYAFEAGEMIGYCDNFIGKLKFETIRSIEYLGEEEVFDIEVEGTETFCADEFIVHNSGKSETVATVSGGIAILFPVLANMPMFADDVRLTSFRNGVLIGIFAPALHQAQISFNRMKTRMKSRHAEAVMSDPEINVTFDTNNGQNIALSNGSIITSMSASEGSNIEGNSYHVIIVDEAQDVSNFKYTKSISPMGAFYNATKVLIGTATITKGFFKESIDRNEREYENGTGKRNHFEYDYKTVIKYNPKYAKYIEGEKKRLGEDSDEFRMSYKLEWILERGMFVDDKFEKLGNPNLGISLYDKKKKHIAGIDFGKKNDSTVVTIVEVDYDNPVIVENAKELDAADYIAYNTTVKAWLELGGDNYEEQYPEMIDFLSNFNIIRVVADATGAGSPIVDRLAANLNCEVIPYSFNQSSKSALYKHFDAEIKSKRFSYPADEDTQKTREYRRFIEQFTDLEKTYSGQNMVVSHPPVRDAHDDYPDSAALAVWGSKGEEVSTPENEENLFKKVRQQARTFYSSRNKLTARRR